MNKFKYFGKVPVNLSGYGRVNPKEVIETELEINHPQFKVYKEIPIQVYEKNPVKKVKSKKNKKYKSKGK